MLGRQVRVVQVGRVVEAVDRTVQLFSLHLHMFYSLKYVLTGVLDFKFNQSLPGYLWKNCSLCEATARRLKWNLISVVVTFCQVPPHALCALLSCRPPLAGYSWQQICKLWKPTPENQSIPTRAPTWTTFSLLSANGSSSDPFFVWIFHHWLSPCPIFMRSCKKMKTRQFFMERMKVQMWQLVEKHFWKASPVDRLCRCCGGKRLIATQAKEVINVGTVMQEYAFPAWIDRL